MGTFHTRDCGTEPDICHGDCAQQTVAQNQISGMTLHTRDCGTEPDIWHGDFPH